MSSVALPVPSAEDRPGFESSYEFVESTVPAEGSGSFFVILPEVSSIAGKSLFVVPAHGASKSIFVKHVIEAHISGSHNHVVLPAALRTHSFEGTLTPMAVSAEPVLSRAQKIQAFLDGASSIIGFGSKKPKELTEKDRQDRVVERMNNYRRYLKGDDN